MVTPFSLPLGFWTHSEDFRDEDEIFRALEREEEEDYTMTRLREERMEQLKREWVPLVPASRFGLECRSHQPYTRFFDSIAP